VSDREVYPLFLLLHRRLVVVVGGGRVAERKVEALLSAGASVRVVAEQATPALERLAAEGRVAHRRKPFDEPELEGAWLVVACTDDPATQRSIADHCERRRLFCLAVDDVANATAYGGSLIRRPPFTVAISSGGAAPALTRLVREVIEAALPAEDYVARARALRAHWKRDRVPIASRFPTLLRELVAIARKERR
jgi:uroporphyrin-III C-methyltransferase/precorrin-2 dehydrogenase/sirohydrochlorin ferrochelatase